MSRPLFGPDRQTLGHPATTRFLDRLAAEDRPAAARDEHACGRCGRPAAYLDRSLSGTVLYICYACGDHKGHPTLVQPGRYAPTALGITDTGSGRGMSPQRVERP